MRLLIIFISLFFISNTNAQCRGFAKEYCKKILGNYVATGESCQ